MVQFFQLGQTAKGRINEEIGKGVGAGIGGALQEVGEYKKQRGRLQEALGMIDKMSPEEKKDPTKMLPTLLSAMAGVPGGEKYASAIYENSIKQQQQVKQQKEQQVLSRATRGEPVIAQEMASLSPETQMSLAKIQGQLQKERQKQSILSSVFPQADNQGQNIQGQAAPPAGQATAQVPGPLTPPKYPQQDSGKAGNLSDQQIAAL